MEIILNLFLSGLASGSIYALLGISIVLIFNTNGVINFAAGDIGLFFCFLCFYLFSEAGLPQIVSILIVLLISMLFGLVFQRRVLYYINLTTEKKLLQYVKTHIKKGYPLPMTLATLGLALVFNGICGQLFGTDTKFFQPLFKGTILLFESFTISYQEIFTVLCCSVFIIIFIFLFLEKTKIGIAMRAVAEDIYASQLMGIAPNKVYSIVWLVSCMFSTLSALMIAMLKGTLDINTMLPVQLKSFSCIVLSGFDSMIGIFIAGIIIGVLENFVAYYISSGFKDVISMIIIVVVLLVIPYGLFGKRKVIKV